MAPEDVVDGRADADAISLVVEDVLGLAEGYYQSGDAGFAKLATISTACRIRAADRMKLGAHS